MHFRTQWVYDFLVFYILVWMLKPRLFVFTRNLTGSGIKVEWNITLKTGSRPRSIFSLFLLYIKSVPREVCEYAQQDSWALYSISLCTYLSARCGRGTALKGGFSVLKAFVAVSQSWYCYLTGVLCIITPCHCSRRSKAIPGFHLFMEDQNKSKIIKWLNKQINMPLKGTRKPNVGNN